MNVKLKNVRLSFPQLFVPKAFSSEGDDEKEPRYGASFIMDKVKNKAEIKAIKDAIEELAQAQWKGKIPGSLKRCLRDGAEKDETDGYGDEVMFLSASCKKRPSVVGRDLSPLTEKDGIIYAGCYVNATIALWVQDNKWGKRVNARLRAVQFCKDGDVFGEAPIDPNQEFENLDDDGDGDDDLLG